MFGFRRRVYLNTAIETVQKLIAKHTSEADFDYAMGAFIGTMRGERESGAIQWKELYSAYQKAGLNTDEAALQLIDGVISSIKGPTNRAVDKSTKDRCILLLENVIDCETRQRGSSLRCRPRNGRVAEAFSAAGMDDFFKTVGP